MIYFIIVAVIAFIVSFIVSTSAVNRVYKKGKEEEKKEEEKKKKWCNRWLFKEEISSFWSNFACSLIGWFSLSYCIYELLKYRNDLSQVSFGYVIIIIFLAIFGTLGIIGLLPQVLLSMKVDELLGKIIKALSK
jgi:glycerol uptake facilitator-like aquaporin